MSAAASYLGRPGVVVAGVSIAQDIEGRYNLNDLHRASGGEKKNGPSYWLANAQTADLIGEIGTAGIPVVSVPGRGGGTYVVRELVYSYAMWISPAFHLKVIRAYDTLVQSQTLAIPSDYGKALRALADEFEKTQFLEKQITIMQPQVDALVRLADTGHSMCQRDAAKHLQIKPMTFTRWLLSMGWTYRRTENSRIVAFQERIDRGHLMHKLVEFDSSDGGKRQEPHVRVTPKGLARLACLIEKGEGPK